MCQSAAVPGDACSHMHGPAGGLMLHERVCRPSSSACASHASSPDGRVFKDRSSVVPSLWRVHLQTAAARVLGAAPRQHAAVVTEAHARLLLLVAASAAASQLQPRRSSHAGCCGMLTRATLALGRWPLVLCSRCCGKDVLSCVALGRSALPPRAPCSERGKEHGVHSSRSLAASDSRLLLLAGEKGGPKPTRQRRCVSVGRSPARKGARPAPTRKPNRAWPLRAVDSGLEHRDRTAPAVKLVVAARHFKQRSPSSAGGPRPQGRQTF
jgi:hypothetical protein